MGEERKPTYFQLFWTFFKLGLFTIGGGMALIPLMQGIIVARHHWMTEEEIVDCLAVSQGLPGVIAINMATYIGKVKRGFLGSVIATIGVILPSFCIIIAICELLGAVGDNRYVTGALVGIKAAATGMIAYSAYKVGKTVLKDSFCWVLAIAAFVLIVFCGVNAVWVILAGIAAGLARGALKERSEKGGEQK